MKRMISFKNLQDILQITLKWETKLRDFYDVAELAMRNDDSKRVVALLKDRLSAKMDVLQNIDMKKFGTTEWIRYLPDYKDEDLIPVGAIRRESSPDELFTHLLGYEEKLRIVYSRIGETLINQRQKELFESLAQFKGEQIEEIKRLMAHYRENKGDFGS